MSKNYDNWERLVRALLRREQLREIAFSHSRSCSSTSSASSNSSYHEQDSVLPESSSYGERLSARDYLGSPLVQSRLETEFFIEYPGGCRYKIQEVIGKGCYGVVGSAIDTHTGEKIAIKKISCAFKHVSNAKQMLREIKLLRHLQHPDIVGIKHIMLPPHRNVRDIYLVFELMDSDLHQVIKANDDLTSEHYQFFLYQLLRGLKYIHTANVLHQGLKPRKILANANRKLKICDFGIAHVPSNDAPTAIFWDDSVGNWWYHAPELCGSFDTKVSSS